MERDFRITRKRRERQRARLYRLHDSFREWLFNRRRKVARRRLDRRYKTGVRKALRTLRKQPHVWVLRRVVAVRLKRMGFQSQPARNRAGQEGYAILHPNFRREKPKPQDAKDAN